MTEDESDKPELHIKCFHATWCNPSINLLKQLKKEKFKNIQLIDIDKEKELTQKHKVKGTPYLVIEKHGKSVKELMGCKDINQLNEACKVGLEDRI